MYGFIGEEFIIMPSTRLATSFPGVYQCPDTHPNSASGAKTVFDCYKYDANGKKVYYTNSSYENCKDALKSLYSNLQVTLDKADQILKYLQDNLNNQPVAP